MIRIKRNTDNLFSLLQFIAFVINTFSHLTDAFIRSDLQENVEVRGFKLATLQLRTGNGILCILHTCRQVFIHKYHPINIPTHLALTAVVVLNFAMIMVLYSS